MSKIHTESNVAVGGCGCWIAVFVFNLLFGGWSVNFLLSLLDKNIPFFWDIVIGLFTAEVTVPIAVVTWILRHFGVL